ncbi:MAG: N-acetyltransferase [Spirochaetales bacterium]|nr:N-acetyltransferase [Spirochaetales bacterium]
MGNNIIIRRATVLDADRIHQLIKAHSDKGLMLAKTPYKIFSNIQKFFVAESNGEILGCVALSVLWSDCAEITSLAVDADHFGQGIGRMMVSECIADAKRLKINKIFALTYQEAFFEKLGFLKSSKDMFPRKLWRECLECPKLEVCDEKAYMLDIK